MKCTKCGYQNKPDANSCNLCGVVLRKEKPAPAAAAAPAKAAPAKQHVLARPGMPPIVLEPGTPFTIGRQTGCSLVVPSNRVSRVHAEIRWENDQPVLSDKGSSNGTFVGGKRVRDHVLVHGNEIEIGPFLASYQFGDPAAAIAPEDPAIEGTQTIAGAGDLFTGLIGESNLAEIVQGLEFNGKTGTLDVFGREGDGFLVVMKGVPHAAEAKGGTLKDDEAIFYLLSLKSGRYSFTTVIEKPEKRMRLTITALLLEWGRRQDESGQHQDRLTTRFD